MANECVRRFGRAGFIAFALSALLLPALAQPARPAPYFTAGEVSLLERNAAVRQVLADNPWLVRRVLDDIARQGGQPFVPPDSQEEVNNPQPRSSPEAAYDLFQLLKQAGADKQGRPAK